MRAAAGPAAVAVNDIDLAFRGLMVLTGLSLDILEGETVGLVGPNGAGKTSLLNCINRVYAAQRGSISIFGRSIDRKRPDQVARMGVARTFQTFVGFKNNKVLDLVLLGRHVRLGPNFFSYLTGVPILTGYERRERQNARRYLELVGLQTDDREFVGELPYGRAKLVDLARALAAEPRILLLDEPGSGLSSQERMEITVTLRRIRDELNLTLVVVEHDMTLVERTCDRVVVLKDGAKLADGEAAVVLRDPQVVEGLMGRLTEDAVADRL
jgi:branched-chain amino acid transport system ATP-binding protein